MIVTVTCPKGHPSEVEHHDLGKRVRCPHEGCGIEFELRLPPASATTADASGHAAPSIVPVVTAQGAPAFSQPGVPGAAVAAPRKGMAITALVLACIGVVVCPLVELAGVIVGIVAVVKANRAPSEYGGKGLAIGGICIGVAGIIFQVAAVVVFLKAFAPEARQVVDGMKCNFGMIRLGEAMRAYADAHDGKFPPDLKTLIESSKLKREDFRCPASTATLADLEKDLEACYVYVKGQTLKDDPNNVLLYERPGNHGLMGANVLCVNGVVEPVQPYSEVLKLVAETEKRIAERNEKPE